ncbi:guanylate-binding protein 1-like [Hypanus sabinus]|uniref:guanylate-binding protein 1-like n=1 Tax=Hypanus sabinus TaxID=79690 RepID=UPI0028C51048|nr:guanylate-binding protein 1-like [Hypanus sabinus]
MEKPLQLVYNIDGKLKLNPEALLVLKSFEDPMIVVAVVGAARTGKSYLMNCLAGDKNGFSVDSTVQSHTKGIWMWIRTLPQRPNEVLLLLDTEGLGDPEKGDTANDHSIYSLAILLSSIFIYNGKNQIDQKSLQDLQYPSMVSLTLHSFILDVAPIFVAELSKRIEMKSQSDDCDSWNFLRFFPEFVWVIRDFTLDLNIDGKPVTPNEYLEFSLKLKDSEISEQDKKYNELRKCIRNLFPSRCCFAFPFPTHPNKVNQLQKMKDTILDNDFIKEQNAFISYIYGHKKVKRVLGGQLVTGRRFAELAKMYVDMMVDGVIPCVESSIAKLMEVENQSAVDEALKFYDNEMKKFSESDNLTMSKLEEYYTKKKGEAFNIFHKRCMNNNSIKHIKQLEETMSSTYKSLMAKIKEKSQEQCKAHLEKEMASVKENLKSRHYLRAGGFQELKTDLEKAIKEYEERTKNEMEGCAVLAHFLEEERPRLDHVQEMDCRLMEEQKHASALEGELSRLKQEMEKLEQKRKAYEECRNNEIMEQIRKKFEEGKTYNVKELNEAMEHMRSEKEKYENEGRKEDAERAQQRYEYLKKKYTESTEWDFAKFIDKNASVVLDVFPLLKGLYQIYRLIRPAGHKKSEEN